MKLNKKTKYYTNHLGKPMQGTIIKKIDDSIYFKIFETGDIYFLNSNDIFEEKSISNKENKQAPKPTVSKSTYIPSNKYTNFITIEFQLPSKLSSSSIIVVPNEKIKSINGVNLNNFSNIELGNRYNSRDTYLFNDISFEFNSNLSVSNGIDLYQIIVDWHRLAYNPETGVAALKRDIIGNMNINFYNEKGLRYKIIKLYSAFPIGIPESKDSDFGESLSSQNFAITFRIDYYEEILTD